jgi:hypothetical protein
MKTTSSFETRRIGIGRTAVTRRVIELAGDMHISPAEVIRMAKTHRARAGFLSGTTLAGLPLGPAVQKHFDAVIAGYSDEKFLAERAALLEQARAHDDDSKIRRQLASIRVETYSNYLYAPALWLSQYCNVVNLKADERPVAQRITKQEVNIYGVGGDGEPYMVKIALDPDETLIPLGFITSDIVRYRKIDVYRGRVTDPALATIKLSYDIGNRIDGQIQNLLLGNPTAIARWTSSAGQTQSAFFGPFTFTGKRANWTYVANSRINVANLPPSNNVDVYQQDGVTLTTQFGFQVLAAIVDYCARWDGAFEDGVNLKPSGRIILPPAHIKEIMNGIFPSGATRNNIADELMEQGWFGVNFLGIDWLFVPDTTLDPTQRLCYPEFNKKPVEVYFKPELDEEKTSQGDYDHEKKNEEERYMRRVFGAYYDSSRRAYAARFNYSGTAMNS